MFYYGLNDAYNLLDHPHEIIPQMDNQGGIEKLAADICHPRDTMETDIGVVMAYKELQKMIRH